MNYYKYILVLLFSGLLISCGNDASKNKKENAKEAIKHYYCSNDTCEGTDSQIAGNCPKCNVPYTHNQAFHNSEFLKNGPLKIQSNTPLPNSNTNLNTTTNTPAEPAQNDLGVWHYTCPKACVGGSGSPTNCATCGELLEHNSIYHN